MGCSSLFYAVVVCLLIVAASAKHYETRLLNTGLGICVSCSLAGTGRKNEFGQTVAANATDVYLCFHILVAV